MAEQHDTPTSPDGVHEPDAVEGTQPVEEAPPAAGEAAGDEQADGLRPQITALLGCC